MIAALPHGSLAAVPTPVTAAGEVDSDAMARILDAIVAAGVSGALVLGSTGEVAALSVAARAAAVRAARAALPPSFPLIVGVANPSLDGARADIEVAEEHEACAVLVAPPYYGPVGQTAVARFYTQLSDGTDLPMVGYHIPAFTGVRIEPQTVQSLARDGILVGVKDSNRDLEYFQQIVAVGAHLDGPWNAYIGTDSLLLPALMLGAAGGITLVASIVPAMTARLVDLHREGDLASAAELQRVITRVLLAVRRGSFPAGGKAALSILGRCRPDLVPPGLGLDEAEIDALRSDLLEFDLAAWSPSGARG